MTNFNWANVCPTFFIIFNVTSKTCSRPNLFKLLKPVTLKDIAKALNLSSSTVSRALKSSYKISEETQQKVKNFALANNYKPNLNAQSLKNKNSRSIGVLVSTISNNFFGEVISGIESVTNSYNYHVIITQSHESNEKEVKNLQHLMWRSVDGLLISVSSGANDYTHIQQVHEQGVPIVFFDRVLNSINTHQVVADNIKGSYETTHHLIRSGHTKVAIVNSSPLLSITRQRQEGYGKALIEAGIPKKDSYIKYCEHGGMIREEIETVIDDLLFLNNPPDAIFTASDRITIGSFSALKRRGIDVPGRMAIAGFSNFSAPELFCPSLTTVKQPAFNMGKTAAELLIELIESRKPLLKPERIVLPTELIIRDSSVKSSAHTTVSSTNGQKH